MCKYVLEGADKTYKQHIQTIYTHMPYIYIYIRVYDVIHQHRHRHRHRRHHHHHHHHHLMRAGAEVQQCGFHSQQWGRKKKSGER